MATLYAKAAGGNWSAAATWSATSSAGVDDAGPPTNADTCIFDAGATGTVTINTTTCTCKVLTCQSADNKIAFGANTTLTIVTDGSVTLFAGMSVTGSTGLLYTSGTVTLTTNGVAIPNFTAYSSAQITLGSDLVITGTWSSNSTGPVFTGIFNITCSIFCYYGSSMTLVAGTTLTVQTKIAIGFNGYTSAGTTLTVTSILSKTASSPVLLVYQGTAADCRITNAKFTDIDASTSTIGILNSYMGDTLLRVGNAVFTVSAANATAGTTYTHNGQTYTVDATISGATTLRTTCQAKPVPLASGTLTKASGTGDSTITFSAVTIAGIVNVAQTDLAVVGDRAKILTGQTVGGVAGSASAGSGGDSSRGVMRGMSGHL